MIPPESSSCSASNFKLHDTQRLRPSKSPHTGPPSLSGPDNRDNRDNHSRFLSGRRSNSMSGYRPADSSARSPQSRSPPYHHHRERSPQPPASPSSDDEYRRDSHDLNITTGGRGRESLLDNLLLSFDHIGGGVEDLGSFGGLGALEASPYFSTVDEVEDTTDDDDDLNQDSLSEYSTRDVGAPGGFSSPYAASIGRRRLGSHGDGDYSNYEGSFGVTYDNSSREHTRSRSGRGLPVDSSHGAGGGYSNGFDPYYGAAPAPSIRTRNRTPSPPRSPRLVRRPSNKSNRSLRRDRDLHLQHQYSNSHAEALPPIPAFRAPPQPIAPPPPMVPGTKSGKPGFFRRVFGGGGSAAASPPTPPPAPAPAPQLDVKRVATPPPPIESLPAVITKKASFFRRRKKSVSDVDKHPMPAASTPVKQYAMQTQPFSETAVNSPTESLRTAMKPYMRAPTAGRMAPLESPTREDERESAYLEQNATVRSVASLDPLATRLPTFYSESSRNLDADTLSDSGNVRSQYKNESWNARGTAPEDHSLSSQPRLKSVDSGRPQTSPDKQNSMFTNDEYDEETQWPPITKRGGLPKKRPVTHGENQGLGIESEKEQQMRQLQQSQPRKISVTSEPIVNIQEYERQTAEKEMAEKEKADAKEAAPARLGLDTENLEPPSLDRSWLSTGTLPQSNSPPITTPTVTISRDGLADKAELLEEEEEDEDKRMAQQIFDGDEEFVSKARAAAWLGEEGEPRERVRIAYLALFDYKGVNILTAMRILCGRVVFKGETQQVDRIMVAFAHRWCECNPNHGFKDIDVVHTILYSLLMLNTDLHLADIPNSSRMTRGQFLKNTMSTIKQGLAETSACKEKEREDREAQEAEMKLNHNNTDPSQSTPPPGEDMSALKNTTSATFPLDKSHKHEKTPSLEFGKEFRNPSRISRLGNLSPRLPDEVIEKQDYDMDGDMALVNAPVAGGLRVWETQMEIILKDFYQSIKSVALPLHGSSQEKIDTSNNHSLFGSGGMLRRTPSTISKAASELSVGAQRGNNSAKLNAKWTAKNRSRQRVYNGSFAGSSRTSLEDRSSLWSPSASSTWSKYSLDKTQTSMSVDSLASNFGHEYQQSIGFANALSHAIIREEAASGHSGVSDSNLELLDRDDELELHGAPWAKEGLLKHKHHLNSADKRARNRNWTECFAVIQRGYMRLFLFPSKSSSKDQKKNSTDGVFGGGNWTENAEPIGTFLLRQTIASTLPPPGYSKSRPNVWALSLPSGAVHFFEVGTADIVKEFVSTANYWSARLSKEPLVGGVSNVEYGWGDCITDYIGQQPATSGSGTTSPLPDSVRSDSVLGQHPRGSLQMSIRSSIDHPSGMVRPRLPGDKIHIKDWSPPSQTMVASSLPEADQLKALQNYVENIEAELARHNELRGAMQVAFSPRHPNSTRALNNWEKKSSYLLREIIKFRTYIETLQSATARREVVLAERAAHAASIA